jgi:hypothetical protein
MGFNGKFCMADSRTSFGIVEDGALIYLCVGYHPYCASLLPNNVCFELGAMDTARHTYMAEYTWFYDQEDNNPRIIRGCTA